MKQLYNYEDRLVRFAGEVVFFVGTAPENYAGKYYSNQLTRSSGSGVLNYGEAQGTVTKKDSDSQFRLKSRLIASFDFSASYGKSSSPL